MADQNAKDIAETYHKIKTEDIEPLEERVGVLEAKAVEHDEKIAGIWDDLNRFRFSGSDGGIHRYDLYGPADDAKHYKNPWNPDGGIRAHQLQNKLVYVEHRSEKGVSIDEAQCRARHLWRNGYKGYVLQHDLNLSLTTRAARLR